MKRGLDGLACRYRLLPGGRRRILAAMLPGETCDMQAAILGETDHAVGTLPPRRIARRLRVEAVIAVIIHEIHRLIAGADEKTWRGSRPLVLDERA